MDTNKQTNKQTIYIVASYTDTIPGRIIVARCTLGYWKQYAGKYYSHISFSLDRSLTEMYSFARKKIYNPLNAGLIKEDIHSGMFAQKPDISRIAVFELNVKKWQYKRLKHEVEEAWEHHEQYKYNFLSLFTLMVGYGITIKDHFLCTEWVTNLLNSCSIELFGKKAPIKVTPYDYCRELGNYIIYEGLTKDYPFYNKEIQYSSAINC